SGCSSRIGDVGILPIESDTVYGSWKVPEAQDSATSRHRDGLVNGAIPRGLATDRASQESGEGAAVRLRVGNKGCGIGVQIDPWRECPCLEITVNKNAIVRCRCRCGRSRRGGGGRRGSSGCSCS